MLFHIETTTDGTARHEVFTRHTDTLKGTPDIVSEGGLEPPSPCED